MQELLATWPSFAVTLVRVTLGVVFFAHGAQKVLGWWGGAGLSNTVLHLGSVGVSRPAAYAVCFVELLGGIALMLGLLTRPAALAVALVMLGAIVKVHARWGFFINWMQTPGRGHGIEADLAYLAMALACLLAGGGALSLDRVLG